MGIKIKLRRSPRMSGGVKKALWGLTGLAVLGTSLLSPIADVASSYLSSNRTIPVVEQLPEGDYLLLHSPTNRANAVAYAEKMKGELKETDCHSCRPALESFVKDGVEHTRITISIGTDDKDDFKAALAYARTKSEDPRLLMKRDGVDRFSGFEAEITDTMDKLDTVRAMRGTPKLMNADLDPDSFMRAGYKLYTDASGMEVSQGYDSRFKKFIGPTATAIKRHNTRGVCEPQYLMDFSYTTVWGESSFDHKEIGKAGEVGATQIFPSTGWDIDRRMRNAGLSRPQHEVKEYETILVDIPEHMDRYVWSAVDGFERWTERLQRPCEDPRVSEMVAAEHNMGLTGAEKYYVMTEKKGGEPVYYARRGQARLAALKASPMSTTGS